MPICIGISILCRTRGSLQGVNRITVLMVLNWCMRQLTVTAKLGERG